MLQLLGPITTSYLSLFDKLYFHFILELSLLLPRGNDSNNAGQNFPVIIDETKP